MYNAAKQCRSDRLDASSIPNSEVNGQPSVLAQAGQSPLVAFGSTSLHSASHTSLLPSCRDQPSMPGRPSLSLRLVPLSYCSPHRTLFRSCISYFALRPHPACHLVPFSFAWLSRLLPSVQALDMTSSTFIGAPSSSPFITSLPHRCGPLL